MRAIIEIDTTEFELLNGNVVVYQNGKFVAMRHDIAFKTELDEIKELKESNEELQNKVNELTKNINDLAKVIKGVIEE